VLPESAEPVADRSLVNPPLFCDGIELANQSARFPVCVKQEVREESEGAAHGFVMFKSLGVILMRHILSAAHFAGRCRISARACNRFESTAFLVIRALSFSDRAKL